MALDVADLEAGRYLLDGRTLQVGAGGTSIELKPGTRGWIRRLAPPQWRRGVVGGSQAGAVRTAWIALIVAIAGDATVEWLTSLERLFLCENKLLQERIARGLGVPTPETVVTADPASIPGELGEYLVVKPLGTGHYTNDESAEQVVWAQPIDRAAPELELLAGAPFILQRRLRADRHLRVVTVRGTAWVYELDAAGLALDWRVSEEAHHSFVAAGEPEIARQALAVARAMNVGYSSQDWIVAAGAAYFVDLNPAGQWLFLPEPGVSEITSSIAIWLAG